jgi:hypothetical protein
MDAVIVLLPPITGDSGLFGMIFQSEFQVCHGTE